MENQNDVLLDMVEHHYFVAVKVMVVGIRNAYSESVTIDKVLMVELNQNLITAIDQMVKEANWVTVHSYRIISIKIVPECDGCRSPMIANQQAHSYPGGCIYMPGMTPD